MIDLANLIIRESYLPGDSCMLPNRSIREAIEKAHRFVLDSDMSEMLGHLSITPYDMSPRKKRGEVLLAQRRSARLPFERIFVQYDGRAFRRGLLASSKESKKDLWGKELLPADTGDVMDPVGWLMECSQDQVHGAVVVVSEFFLLDGHVGSLPFAWVYTPDEIDITAMDQAVVKRHGNVEGFGQLDVPSAQLAHGLQGFTDTGCAILYMSQRGKAGIPPQHLVDVTDEAGKFLFQTHYLIVEGGGALRYMYAFLNMLNEVPVSYERPRRTQAYLANGKRRVAVDHQVIRLILPNRTITYREYARQLSRGVIKRAAHPVRGHWRVYGAHHCGEHEQHDWGATDATGHADCKRCSTSRTWINNYRTGVHERTEAVSKMYSVGVRHSGSMS